jgi:hypothetical protein
MNNYRGPRPLPSLPIRRSVDPSQAKSGDDLSHCILDGVDFSYRSLDRVSFANASLRRAIFTSARLRFADFSNAMLDDAVFNDANISHATFERASCVRATFERANAEQASFYQTRLEAAVLEGADFLDSYMVGTYLTGAVLKGARLWGAIFSPWDVGNADFSGAMFGGTHFGYSFAPNGDFTLMYGAVGLDQTEHHGPSDVSMLALFNARNVDERFLRSIGVPDGLLSLRRSVQSGATSMTLYSCFLSHSTSDHNFCSRLYSDLRRVDIHCWYAPEDLKIGEKFRARIEDSINRHDKVLLVLSEHSINSPWVESEVEAALEKERLTGATVLFPLRLDNAVMKTAQAWAAEIRRTRHIGDFSDWQDEQSYRRALDRLYRDLSPPRNAASPDTS